MAIEQDIVIAAAPSDDHLIQLSNTDPKYQWVFPEAQVANCSLDCGLMYWTFQILMISLSWGAYWSSCPSPFLVRLLCMDALSEERLECSVAYGLFPHNSYAALIWRLCNSLLMPEGANKGSVKEEGNKENERGGRFDWFEERGVWEWKEVGRREIEGGEAKIGQEVKVEKVGLAVHRSS